MMTWSDDGDDDEEGDEGDNDDEEEEEEASDDSRCECIAARFVKLVKDNMNKLKVLVTHEDRNSYW